MASGKVLSGRMASARDVDPESKTRQNRKNIFFSREAVAMSGKRKPEQPGSVIDKLTKPVSAPKPAAAAPSAGETTPAAGTGRMQSSSLLSFFSPAPAVKASEAMPPPTDAPVLTRRSVNEQAIRMDNIPDVRVEGVSDPSHAEASYVIRAYVAGVRYSAFNGVQGVILKETNLPEAPEKKRGEKGRGQKGEKKAKKRKSANAFRDDEAHDDDDDDEDDVTDIDQTDDDEEEDNAAEEAAAAAGADDFVVKNDNEDEGASSSDGEWTDSEESKKRKRDVGAEDGDENGEKPSKKKKKTEEDEEDVASVEEIHEEDEHPAVSDLAPTAAAAATPPPTVQPEKPKEKRPPVSELKVDETVKDIVAAFEIGGSKKNKKKRRASPPVGDKPGSPSKTPVSPERKDKEAAECEESSDEDQAPRAAPTEEVYEVAPVHVGETHEARGRLPTTCPLVIMDIRVIKSATSNELKILDVLKLYRTWESPLTKGKLTSSLVMLGLCESAATLKTALTPLGSKTREPISPEALRRITDKRFGWMCAGALLEDKQWEIASAIGLPVYEMLARNPNVLNEVIACVREKPENLLFAEEKLSAACARTGLVDLEFDDFMRLPTAKTLGSSKLTLLKWAWLAYKRLRLAVEVFGDTMTSREALAAALAADKMFTSGGTDSTAALELQKRVLQYLYDIEATIELMDNVALKSVLEKEHGLAIDILKKAASPRANVPVAGAKCGSERDTVMRSLRSDMAHAIQVLENSSICVLDGPDETAVFLVAALQRLCPGSEICVATFDAKAKYAPVSSYKLPMEINAFVKHAKDIAPPLVILAACERASTDSMAKAVAAIMPKTKLVLVGDSYAAAPLPRRPEFGRPFVGICAASCKAIPRICLGSQTAKTGVDAAIEVLMSDRMRPADALKEVLAQFPDSVAVENVDPSALHAGMAEVYFTTGSVDEAKLYHLTGSGDRDVFKRGDLVTLRIDGKRVMAGRLTAIKDGYDNLLAINGSVRQPFAKPKPTAADPTVTRLCYCNEVTVQVENSGPADKQEEMTTMDRYPLAHIVVTNIRTVPPFKTDRVCLVIGRSTSARDIYAAAMMTKKKLTFVGDTTTVAAALEKVHGPQSALAYVLENATPR